MDVPATADSTRPRGEILELDGAPCPGDVVGEAFDRVGSEDSQGELFGFGEEIGMRGEQAGEDGGALITGERGESGVDGSRRWGVNGWTPR